MRVWGRSESRDENDRIRRVRRFAAVLGKKKLVGIAALIMSLLPLLDGNHALAQGAIQPVPLPLLPTSVAFDTAGNLYFADTNRHIVYESSLAGVLSVVAGDGAQGFSGDGGAATSAELNSPQGVAVGPDGTLYIADTGNERVRAVSNGIITTFAGNGTTGSSGDGGASASATFRGPNALAVDATGALLVCDAANQRVRRISAGVIQTVVGNGVQGIGGDGGPASGAELDTPMGLAAASDGRIFVADSHNHRIRVIATSGVISTFAGTGVAGYAGDGGPARAAKLSLPRGLIVTSSGAVIFADSNNQRLRMVDANGTITTIVGSGLQGAGSDGVPALAIAMNSPRAVAASSFGAPVYADALNRLVRETVSNGNIYIPAGLAPTRTTQISLTALPGGGQISTSVTVSGSAGTVQGIVHLLDGENILSQAILLDGAATFPTPTLSTGSHSLTATYLGDGVNPAAISAPVSLTTGTGVITATASAVTMRYGQALPLLTGTVSGLPLQGVIVTFLTAATSFSPVGIYPITAALSGLASGDYAIVMSPTSGDLQIAPAASITTEQPVTQNSYAGLPLLMTAKVGSTTQGTPTGTVTFLDNGIVVASATLFGGAATGTYLAPATGIHFIVANYAGDNNFTASTSQALTAMVSAMPDFSMSTAGSVTQTVAAGNVASYGVTVAPQSSPFTGVVDFSASGLPPGATASFSPPQIVPGSASVNVAMNIQTSAVQLTRTFWPSRSIALAGLLCPLWLLSLRNRATCRWLARCGLLAAMVGLSACGARTVSTPLLGGKTYTLTVTATATNLAGAIVSHSVLVTLVVE